MNNLLDSPTQKTSSAQKSFCSENASGTFLHKQLDEKLRKGFSDNSARIMSETLMEFAEYQEDKLMKRMDKIVADLMQQIDQRLLRFAADFHKELHKKLHLLTWRFINAK